MKLALTVAVSLINKEIIYEVRSSRHRDGRRCSACFYYLVLAGAAQSYRGRVQGVVTDQSQAVIAGATVTLLNVGTGVSVVRQSGESGQYLFDLVDPGTYTVTVELPGFRSSSRRTSWFRRAATSRSTPLLKAGSVQESVTVTEAPRIRAVQFQQQGS